MDRCSVLTTCTHHMLGKRLALSAAVHEYYVIKRVYLDFVTVRNINHTHMNNLLQLLCVGKTDRVVFPILIQLFTNIAYVNCAKHPLPLQTKT